MTLATDSISGNITRGYDGLDRLTSETTPQGNISYTYDNASRRATMQVAGQSQVSYAFDNAAVPCKTMVTEAAKCADDSR